MNHDAADGFRILIVEDDPRMRRVLELLLSDRWRVESAGDGEEALAMAHASPPDLVVADLLMPGLDGIALLRRLRSRPETAAVPVIMVSGVTDEERRLEALDAGASDFLVKPFGERELVARMGAQLELASQRREQNEARMRAILDGALDAVIGMNAAGLVTFWNPQAEKLFGWARAEVLGHDLCELILPPGSMAADCTGVHRLIRHGEDSILDRRVELLARRRDGGSVPVEIAVTRIPGGTPASYTAFVEDITARKQAESERERLLALAQEARGQAEAASRAKDHFLATLSHELRTPLNAIMGWAHLLRVGGLEPEIKGRALDVIERNARVQAQLIGDILEITRIVQGKMRLDVRRVDVRDVIAAVLDTVRPSAEPRQVRLVADIGEVPALSADPDRLQQILWNLLSNAIKFTPRGGVVRLALESAGSHVRLTVKDSGPGISPEFLPHVFDPFAQETASRTHGGLGLGLAIVRHLVEMHGGTISVSSPAGEGTTFTVRLPWSLQAEEAPPAVPRPAPSASDAPVALPRLDGIRVLVVDDEADTCDAITAMLQGRGATAVSVHTVDEALGALQRERPHVLLSDIAMPGADGYELIRRVRALAPEDGGLLPVAALTAYARPEDRVRALTAGFHLHVAKPIDPGELVTVVASLAGRTREMSVRE